MSKAKNLILPVLLFVSLRPEVAVASCVVPGSGPSQDHSRLRLNIPSGIPPTVRDGILAGKNQWNSSTCNIGEDDFPFLVTSGSGYPEIDINYEPGFSDVTNPSSGNTVCGLRENGEITIFGTLRKADGSFMTLFSPSS